MEVDHIGYAVKNMDRAIDVLYELGFIFEPEISDEERNIRISFGQMDGYKIELVSPLDKERTSPVDQYLKNTVGTPYHICYRSNGLDDEVAMLKARGFKVIIEPRPAVAFNGKRVVFLFNLGIGLIEIVEN